MDGRDYTKKQFLAMQEKFALWKMQNPKCTSSEELQALMRLYEIHNYGITSRDLALGRTVDWIEEDGMYRKVEAAVSGIFYCDPVSRGDMPQCHFNRAAFKMSEDGSKRMTFKQYIRDAQMVKEDRLEKLEQIALTAQDTGLDTGSGKSLLESAIDSGFGSATGVVRPVFMNMLLELVSLKAFMKNFISIEPMDQMTFYFPMKTTKVEDHAEFTRTALPTAEGRAGTDYAIEYDRYEINGWKYLRHAELTDEINELVGKFINVQSHYVEDLAEGMALLWDWPVVEGIQEMMVTGKWRRPKKGAPITWDTTTEIPFGAAAVLTTEARKSYLFQDQSGVAANDGKIYDADIATGDEFKYQLSDERPGTDNADETYEGIMALATLLKKKRSMIEYIILTDSQQTERLFKDGRFLDARLQTGTPRFQDETGFLGRIAIGGSSSQTDVWEAPEGLFTTRATTDTVNVTPIIAGRYGRGWHQGVFTPINMRVDRGMEVKSGIGVGSSDVLRDNETRVITTGSKGSTWPGDYHHFAILWQSLVTAHT